MEVVFRVCNVCAAGRDPARGVGRQTTAYSITRDGETVQVDLCDQHRVPVEKVLDTAIVGGAPAATPKGTANRRNSRTGGGATRRRSARVMTLEEIEALKGGADG